MMKLNKIYQGDCIEVLKTFPDNSIHCCVTSPPYYGLRDYGQDGQIGLEETPEAFVQKLVEVFREVKRVLKDDGTLWLNLGDSYWGGGWKGSQTDLSGTKQGTNAGTLCGKDLKKDPKHPIIKSKDLVGIPWMVAFALRADGWYLRQDIIWHKPNPMPESVTDRCTKSHEYIFLLSKSQRYFYDADAIKDRMVPSSIKRNQSGWNGNEDRGYVSGKQNHISKYMGSNAAKEAEFANKRSVWTITTKPFSDAHFATYPEDLIVPCIKAGCPKGGIVLDPFGGAATTALVAHKLRRDWVMIELNQDYINIAEKRLRPHLRQMFLF
jgi:DNA modification methylase